MNPALAADVAGTLAAYEDRYGTPSGRVGFLRAALDDGRSVTSLKTSPSTSPAVSSSEIPTDGCFRSATGRSTGGLFPGGHLEPDDASLIAAARREAVEETGLVASDSGATEVHPVPIDIDIHPIPANDGKGEPEHYHADFRYVVQVIEGAIQLQADEVTDWRWADPEQINNPRLAQRLSSL